MLRSKLQQYYQLSKFNLSFLVSFSSVMSYLMVEKVVLDWSMLFYLSLGGFLITVSANTLNQIIEKDTDALMQRTAKRPLASNKMTVTEASWVAFISALVGAIILTYYFNGMTTFVSLLSLGLYAWLYTPSKKMNSLAVFIGAIPGALPCLIGWIAGEPSSLLGGWILFLLQFFWQFPHFWAIAWLSHEDYTKAGFKLLPSTNGPSQYAAMQAIIYSLLLIPIGFAPFLIGMCTWMGAIIIFMANIGMVWLCIRLLKKMNASAAKAVMFGSYIYLPIVFLLCFGVK